MLFRIAALLSSRIPASFYAVVTCLCAAPVLAFDVTLRPLDDEDLENAIKAASLTFSLQEEGVDTAQDILAAARADYRQILGALYQSGYYGGSISIRVDGTEAGEISPFATPSAIRRVAINVNPGRLFTFGKTSIEPLAPNTELPEAFAIGEPALSGEIGTATTAAVNAWRDVGHAKAAPVGQDIIADHPAAQLDVSVALDPGPSVTFGKMKIASNGNVRDARVRQIAGFPTGEQFSPEEIETVTNRLRETNTFRSVVLTEDETVAPDGTMDMTLELVDEKLHRLGFGAEVYTSEGISLTAYWLHRNLFGGAENLSFKAEISGLHGVVDGADYSFSTRFSRPGTLSPLNTFFIGAEVALQNEPTYTSRFAFIESGVVRKFSEDLEVTGSLGLRYSDVEDGFGRRQFRHVLLNFTGKRDRRNDDFNPTSGTYEFASATPYIGFAGSETGARLYADFRGYLSPGEKDPVTFAGRAQAGSILGTDLQSTPPEFMFYSGGAETVRGQPYQSLNVNTNGVETGGLSYLGFSAEARYKVTDAIGLVAFGDVGFIGSTSNPGGTGNWHSGAGLGVRYFTGFGPVRLDVALPVSGTTGDGVQFYIGIGQAF